MPSAAQNKPFEVTTMIPTSDGHQNVPVTVFDFKSQLMALLKDPQLFGDLNNLDVNPQDIFGKYRAHNNCLSTVNSGYRYKQAYQTMVVNPTKDFLMPIIFACDETKVSSMGKGACWPLMFTTSILNQEKRNLPRAWKPLGYVYDTSLVLSANEEKELGTHIKYQRLHNILDTILATYVKCQRPGALDGIVLTFGRHSQTVNLKVPCFFIIGDMQGGDKMAGSAPVYQHRVNRLCRKCNVQGRESGNPLVECQKITTNQVIKLLQNNDMEGLKQMNQYNVQNAWFKVDFGGCEFGIFSAACPVEPLHALENGIIDDCLDVLLKKIGPARLLARLDVLARNLVDLPRQQQASSGSDKTMPRLLWKDGISRLTDLTAAAKVGIMFTIVVVSLQTDGHRFFKGILGTDHSVKDMRECFQMLLCYWSWLKKDSYWARSDYKQMQEATQAIRKMLSRIIKLWPREEGQGWNLAKFHEQLHVPDDIFYNGCPKGSHSGPVEHNHIQMVKRPSSRTQKRRSNLDQQLAMRLYESALVNSAQDRMESNRQLALHNMQTKGKKDDGVCPLASKASIKVKYVKGNGTAYGQVGTLTLSPLVLEYIVKEYFVKLKHVTSHNERSKYVLNYFSEYNHNGNLYRSHSNYRGNGPWYDWVIIRWKRTRNVTWSNMLADECHVHFGEEERAKKNHRYLYCPGQILAFTNPEPNIFHAIVKCCNFSFERGSIFSTKWKSAVIYRSHSRHAYLYHVDVSNIVRPCLMIPKDPSDPFTDYEEIWEKSLWANEFF